MEQETQTSSKHKHNTPRNTATSTPVVPEGVLTLLSASSQASAKGSPEGLLQPTDPPRQLQTSRYPQSPPPVTLGLLSSSRNRHTGKTTKSWDGLFQRHPSQPEGRRDTRHHTKASEKCLQSWENKPTISKQREEGCQDRTGKNPIPAV